MKQIFLFALYFFSSLLFSIGLTACSSSNNLNNELNYYNYINGKTEGEEVRITTLEGEDLKGKNLSLKKDSSSWINIIELKSTIPISSIKDVKYTVGGYNNSALIEFRDGVILKGNNVEKHDSMITFHHDTESPVNFPTELIKKVSIKSHFSGALTGFGIGLFAGGIVVGTLININDDRKAYTLTFAGSAVGSILGLITGAILGNWREYYLR